MRTFIMDGKFPYNCNECNGNDLRKKDYHSTIIEFISSDIEYQKNRDDLYNRIKSEFKNKFVWALYGANLEKDDTWICLQVASRIKEDVVTEIIDNIKDMYNEKNNRIRSTWSSKFHSNVFEPNYDYTLLDISSQKYNLIKNKFEKLMFVAIEYDTFLNKELDDDSEFNKQTYAEVKYACDKKPLFWNAFGIEHKIVNQILENKLV